MQTAPRSDMFIWYILYKKGGVEHTSQRIPHLCAPGQEEYLGSGKSSRHNEMLGVQARWKSVATHG